jgi:hypothetical protein
MEPSLVAKPAENSPNFVYQVSFRNIIPKVHLTNDIKGHVGVLEPLINNQMATSNYIL